jgi:hypothetical protein
LLQAASVTLTMHAGGRSQAGGMRAVHARDWSAGTSCPVIFYFKKARAIYTGMSRFDLVGLPPWQWALWEVHGVSAGLIMYRGSQVCMKGCNIYPCAPT